MSKVSIIIPAFNEAVGIARCLREITKAMNASKFDYEVIVIDDGSDDSTCLVSNSVAKNNSKIKLVKNSVNRGKGHAVQRGLQCASGDVIAYMDADFSIHPNQLTLFLSELEKADAVIGSKRHPKSIISYPLHRKFLSRCFNLLVRMMFRIPFSDTQCGFKIFKREVFEKEHSELLTKSYAFDVELLINVYRRGYKIVEAPVTLRHWKDRLGVGDILRIGIDLLPIFYRFYLNRSYA